MRNFCFSSSGERDGADKYDAKRGGGLNCWRHIIYGKAAVEKRQNFLNHAS